MNVSLQNIDKVSALLTVKLEKADYQEKVDKALKTLRRKVQMPGFRPGMVPAGMVKKMYGKSVLAEEVDKLLQDAVYNYIKENNVQIIGQPLPNEDKQQPVDFDTMEEFEFLFDVALSPEFDFTLGKEDVLPYYNIEVSDEMVEQRVKMYASRNGKYETVEEYADGDMLKGILAELDENGNVKEGGIQVEGAVMMPQAMKNDDQKAIFNNAKVNDVLVFNPATAWDNNTAELSSLLKIDKEAAEQMKSNFSYQVNEITRYVPGELNQEVFDSVLGKDAVSTEEEFRAKLKEALAAQMTPNSDYKLLVDLKEKLMEKVGKLEFAEAIIKRLMKVNTPSRTDEDIDKNFEESMKALTWQLISMKFADRYEIKIEDGDIKAGANNFIREQFAQYGMVNFPEELVNSYAQELLKNKEKIDEVADRVMQEKITAKTKELVTLEEKSVSLEEFNKMFQ